MADLDQARAHHDFATRLLPDLHASACMPCSDDLNDASEQPGPLQTSPPASCSGRQARRPASSSGEGPLTSRARGYPPASAQASILRALLASLALEPRSLTSSCHEQHTSSSAAGWCRRSSQAAWTRQQWLALQLWAQVQCLQLCRPRPQAGPQGRGCPVGRLPGSQVPRRQLCRWSATSGTTQPSRSKSPTISRCRHGRPAGCCCVQGHHWLFELRPGMGPASRETDALHPWDEFEPLSVLCCRPKVSAEAVCKEKVRCSGNQVAIAGMDSSYNFDRCGEVSWFTNLRISASESTVVTLPDAEKPVVDCSSKASLLVLAAPVSNAKGSGSFKPCFQIAHTSCASF